MREGFGIAQFAAKRFLSPVGSVPVALGLDEAVFQVPICLSQIFNILHAVCTIEKHTTYSLFCFLCVCVYECGWVCGCFILTHVCSFLVSTPLSLVPDPIFISSLSLNLFFLLPQPIPPSTRHQFKWEIWFALLPKLLTVKGALCESWCWSTYSVRKLNLAAKSYRNS